MIVTFYSFKGGVGRSMAMANVAEILADLGYRVVACDWDLEAPGLERYLALTKAESEEAAARPGLMDLLAEYKTTLTVPPPQEEGEATAEIATTETHANVGPIRLRRPSSYTFEMRAAQPRPGSLRLLSAGARGFRGELYGKYADAVRTFSWDEFYDRWAGGAYMDFVRADLSAGRPANDPAGPPIAPAADIVLIDSRTGVTEHGGVATHHLADLVVLLSAANDLNLDGTTWMADALSDSKLIDLRSDRKLWVLPVASRIEQTSEKNLLGQFRKKFSECFSRRLPSVLGNADEFFLDVEIPYMPFYSFTERMAAREVPPEREVRLYRAYEALAHAIVRCGFEMKVLQKTPIATPARFQSTVHVEPPRGIFALRTSPDMRDAGHALAGLLQQARVNISTEPLPSATDLRSAPSGPGGVVILVGPRTPDGWVRAEFDAALRRQALNPECRIVPVVDPGVRLSALPYLNRARLVQAPLASTSVNVAPIVAALSGAAPVAPEDSGVPPFPGLRPYDETDARLFFGRDAAVAELVSLLRGSDEQPRWLHVDGPTGAGKTSLVAAGVLPAIRLGYLLADAVVGPVAVCHVTANPLVSLAVALAKAAGDTATATAIEQELRAPGGLSTVIRRLTPAGQTFILFVDDVEELAAADHVAGILHAAATRADVPLFLITAAGSEWPHAFPRTHPGGFIQYTLGPMSGEEYRTAAIAPARLAALTWEPQALDHLLRDVAAMQGSPLALPLFAAALRAVWDNRTANLLTAGAYQWVGSFVPTLLREADHRVTELGATEEDAAKRLLVGLTIPKAQGGITRRRIPRAEALKLAGGEAAGESILATLSAPPAVVVDGEQVELSHDVLADRWLSLQRWAADAQASGFRRWRRTAAIAGLAVAALLLLGTIVAQWRTRQASDSQVIATEALRAQDTDPLRGLALAVSAADKFDTAEARTALERALADRYPRVVLHHPVPVIDARFNADGTRIITAAEDDTARVWNAETGDPVMSAAAPASPIAFKSGGRIQTVRFSPARPLAAIPSFDGTTTLLDTNGGQALAVLRGHAGPVVAADFSPNGRLLATASLDGTALVWDVESSRAVAELTGHGAAVTSILFSPRGTQILTTSLDGTGRLWDAQDGRSIATIADQNVVAGMDIGAFGGDNVAIGGLGGVLLMIPDRPLVTLYEGKPISGLTFASGGAWLVTASAHEIYSLEARSGVAVGDFGTEASSGARLSFTSLAADTGTRIAAANADGRVFLWEPLNPRANATLRAHTDAVTRVSFSANGRYLLTASKDSTVCVWDVVAPAAPADKSFDSLLRMGQAIVNRALTQEQLAAIVK